MPIYMKIEGVDGSVTSSAPSVSEIVVTKTSDSAGPSLFDERLAPDSFGFGGYGENTGAHTGGVNVAFGDGSVRFVSDAIPMVFGDFDLM